MGIIIKQSIKGTIWSYLGVLIGFITTAYLYPRFLTPEVVGLFGILLSYTRLFGILANLGINGVTSRLFSYFRNKENGHNGFLFIALLFHILGLIIFLSLYFIFKPVLIESNIEKSSLFVNYLYLIVPLTISMMIFAFLDTFNKMLYNAVFGTFLKEFLQRFLILTITLLFAFQLITLEQLIIFYAIVVSLKGLIILMYLVWKNEIKLKPNLDFLNKKLKHDIINVAAFSLVGGLGSMVVFELDKNYYQSDAGSFKYRGLYYCFLFWNISGYSIKTLIENLGDFSCRCMEKQRYI